MKQEPKIKATSKATDELIGSVVAYSCIIENTSPPPEGWLLCNGSAISRVEYEDLFNTIGVLHGKGDGVSTFNIPDYRGMFLRGADNGAGRDPETTSRNSPAPGGSEKDMVGSVQSYATAPPASENAFSTTTSNNHQHEVPHLPTENSWYHIAGNAYAIWNRDSVNSSEAGEHTHTINGGGDTESRPVNLYVHYLIYYGQKIIQ